MHATQIGDGGWDEWRKGLAGGRVAIDFGTLVREDDEQGMERDEE